VSEQNDNPEQNKKNRKVIVGIFAIPALVFLLSTGLYFMVKSKAIDLGTVNNGQLVLPPLQVDTLSIRDLQQQPFDYSKPEPKWAFVIVGDRDCANDCERMLYIARQSIIALAKKMNRIRLMYVTAGGDISESLQQRFDREYKGLDVVTLSKEALQTLFTELKVTADEDKRFFVVDPRGWLMMYYQVDDTEQPTLNSLGKSVVRDMKRLIK
jgi:hypothetical protein